MEEIILKAKMGPPVSKLVNHHVVVTKELSSASLVETHKSRRITGKQSLNANTVKRELVAAVRHARKQTKREGKATMKKVVDGIVSLANTHGANLKAKYIAELRMIATELVESIYEPNEEAERVQRLNQIVNILRLNGAIN
jgi:hypothetical protein